MSENRVLAPVAFSRAGMQVVELVHELNKTRGSSRRECFDQNRADSVWASVMKGPDRRQNPLFFQESHCPVIRILPDATRAQEIVIFTVPVLLPNRLDDRTECFL